jgi:MFS family permease
MGLLRSVLKPVRPVPADNKSNFTHLYLDMAWSGILNGSTIAFLAVFASRLGADPLQIGLLNAVPAIIALISALPAGQWLERRPIGKGVFIASVLTRLFYLAFVLLPFFFNGKTEVWAIIWVILIMNIPGTALLVGFNALFAEAVPPEWRGHVAGIRNALIAFVGVITNLVCGQILVRVPSPLGYQMVFGLGFLGAAMSTYHLFFVRPRLPAGRIKKELESGLMVVGAPGLEPSRTTAGLSSFGALLRRLGPGQIDIIQGPFKKILLLLFAFHLAQYLGIPIYPLYTVRSLHLSDQIISYGTGIFNGLVFIGSLQLARVTSRFGNKRVMGTGAVFLAFYPGIMALVRNETGYLVASVVGGLAWSMVGGAIYNYLLEKVPSERRPAYLAWYNLALNAAILIASLSGPALAENVGFGFALGFCAIARLLAGIAILRWG